MASANVTSQRQCGFCSSSAKYACPRCNSSYCSANCYRHADHNQCSEQFYKQCIEHEIKGRGVSVEAKKRMEEILRRTEMEDAEGIGREVLEDSLDSDDEEDLADRLEGIDLDDSEAVWSRLSDEEQRRFRDVVASERVAEILPPWTPWWRQDHQKAPLVQELSEASVDSATPSYVEACPTIMQIPNLDDLTKTKPSECIPFNLLNILAAYVYVVRLFHGDHAESCLDAAEALLTLCGALRVAANFNLASQAVSSPFVEAQQHEWLAESEDMSALISEDVRLILKGPTKQDSNYYVISALSDVHSLLFTTKKSLMKKEKTRRNGAQKGAFAFAFAPVDQHVTLKVATAAIVKNSIKKIEYFIAYSKQYSEQLASIFN